MTKLSQLLGLTTNARFTPRVSRVLRFDPSRTTMLQRAMMTESARRFRNLADAITKWLAEDDELGLIPREQVALNAEKYRFLTSDKKLDEFMRWLDQQVDANLLGQVGGLRGQPWTAKYISSAYKKGVVRSYIEANKKKLAADPKLFGQTKEEFLRTAFGSSETTSKIQLLATRTFEEMKGLSAESKKKLNRILAQGLADGKHPRQIAKQMTEEIAKLSRARANTIARTEIIRAHAEGQLDSFQALGVEELGVLAEWSTAGDDAVCPLCEPMEGQVFSIEEARGMIPRHPNCRCTFIPAEELTKKQQQAASKDAQRAIAQSAKRETGEKTGTAARAASRWSGAEP